MGTGASASGEEAPLSSARVLVLGPCTVVAGAGDAQRTVELSALQRRIVARLAMSAPQPVRFDELAEAIWEDGPPRPPVPR